MVEAAFYRYGRQNGSRFIQNGVDAHLNDMARFGTWADGIMIDAASYQYRRQVILVHTSESQSPSVSYHCQSKTNNTIILQYVNGNQYLSMVPYQ
jgi:hypothetical protein